MKRILYKIIIAYIFLMVFVGYIQHVLTQRALKEEGPNAITPSTIAATVRKTARGEGLATADMQAWAIATSTQGEHKVLGRGKEQRMFFEPALPRSDIDGTLHTVRQVLKLRGVRLDGEGVFQREQDISSNRYFFGDGPDKVMVELVHNKGGTVLALYTREHGAKF